MDSIVLDSSSKNNWEPQRSESLEEGRDVSTQEPVSQIQEMSDSVRSPQNDLEGHSESGESENVAQIVAKTNEILSLMRTVPLASKDRKPVFEIQTKINADVSRIEEILSNDHLTLPNLNELQEIFELVRTELRGFLLKNYGPESLRFDADPGMVFNKLVDKIPELIRLIEEAKIKPQKKAGLPAAKQDIHEAAAD